MDEAYLRKWHRTMGIILALFLFLQAASGALMALEFALGTPLGFSAPSPASISGAASGVRSIASFWAWGSWAWPPPAPSFISKSGPEPPNSWTGGNPQPGLGIRAQEGGRRRHIFQALRVTRRLRQNCPETWAPTRLSNGADDVFRGDSLQAPVVRAGAVQAAGFLADIFCFIQVRAPLHPIGADAGRVVGPQQGQGGDPEGQGHVQGAAVVGDQQAAVAQHAGHGDQIIAPAGDQGGAGSRAARASAGTRSRLPLMMRMGAW
jgi:hypothetical protein